MSSYGRTLARLLDIMEQVQAKAGEAGASFSDPMHERVHDFVSRVHVVVAGDSSIHVESALAGATPVYYHQGNEVRDYYGFVSGGLVRDCANSPESLLDRLRDIRVRDESADEVRLRAKPFCSTVGTEHAGASSRLIAGVLENFEPHRITSQYTDPAWNRVSSTVTDFEAYVLGLESDLAIEPVQRADRNGLTNDLAPCTSTGTLRSTIRMSFSSPSTCARKATHSPCIL